MTSPGRNRRREYGTGTLIVRGSSWLGLWYDENGRRVQRKVGDVRIPGVRDGLTKAQAERALRKLREAERPEAVGARVTVEQAGRDFSRRLELRGRKKSHRLTVAADIRNHLAPHFGERTLDQITPEDIEHYIAAKTRKEPRGGTSDSRREEKAEGLAVKTIRNHLNTLHSLFELGLRRGWCNRNPVKLADRPVIKKAETRIQFLEQGELEQLLATSYPDDAWGQVEPTLYLTAAMTGLRQGELRGLRWRDVDFDARKVRVVTTFVRGEFAEPKSVGSARSVPMAERVSDALAELRERSPYSHDGDLVFCHPESGRPLDSSKLIRRFKQALERAEVHQITFHELRHTFGTRMAAAGVPLRTIQHWMGHADSKTTQVYAHYQPSEHEAELVERAFT